MGRGKGNMTIDRKAPQLVCPAGCDLDSVYAAVDAGADAVYVGIKHRKLPDRLVNELSCRGEISCYAPWELEKAFGYCKSHGVELMVALNAQFNQRLREEALRTVEQIHNLGIRTIIASDIAFINRVGADYPDIDIHISILGGTANRLTASLFKEMGAKRVILENHLSMTDLRELRRNTDVELEVFLYGLTCLAFHGSCHISAYDKGVPCLALCNERVTVFTSEGERHGHYLRARDLDLLGLIPELADLGIDAFKIEGRMRSPRYVAVITAAARHLLDCWKRGDASVLPPGLARKVGTLPFFGTTRGYLQPGIPEEISIAVEGGSKLNKLLEMSCNRKLAAYLVKRKFRGNRTARSSREGGDVTVRPNRGRSGPGWRNGRECSQEIVVETSLANPVIPSGADRVFIGEKHCAQRFLSNASRLPELIEVTRESGAVPCITIPGRLAESHVDSVLDVVMSLGEQIHGVNCFDFGLARKLSSSFDVTLTILPGDPTTASAVSQLTGAARLRSAGLPLRDYLENGFPDVPLELQVFGHLPVSGGVFCLTRLFRECQPGKALWWRIKHESSDLRLCGNTLYSEKLVSAHLIRDHLCYLPIGGLVLEAVHQDVDLLERVIRFYRTGTGWPDIDESTLCNGIYVSAPEDRDSVPMPWKSYLPDLASTIFD